MKHLKHLGYDELMGNFPYRQYPNGPTARQKEMFGIIAKADQSVTIESPTGSRKTAVGYAFLKTLEKAGKKPLFYITPNKTLVNQVKDLHPDVKVIYGRNEYPCLYYKGEVSAEDSPCSMLDCSHRVDQATGETEAGGVEPCSYLWAKYEAKKGGIIVCTMSFYLFTHLFSRDWEEAEGLVIDEVHRIASVVRNSLSYEITDYYLDRITELIGGFDTEETRIIGNFKRKLIEIVKVRPAKTAVLLESHEIADLLEDLYKLNPTELRKVVREAVKRGNVDADEKRDILKKTEVMTRSLIRYLKSLEYSLPTDKHKPLNYTYGYYERDGSGGNSKANYRLVIKAYSVAGIIKKILSLNTLAYSATIGDAEVFGWESGIKFPFYSLSSDFPSKNTRIFIPTDTPNLAMKSRNRQDLTKTLRRIAKACRSFANKDKRSLVVVVSEKERQKFMMLCEEEKVRAISYGNGVKPRIAVEKFKKGEGDVLVGTVANYGEGIDLPKNLAPVIFFLRPGYSNPNDPNSIFEERRNGSRRSWALKNWRVMLEALQVRGRNVRSAKDIGVTFFMSQQFRRSMPAILPEWLKDSYNGRLTLDEGVKEAKEILR